MILSLCSLVLFFVISSLLFPFVFLFFFFFFFSLYVCFLLCILCSALCFHEVASWLYIFLTYQKKKKCSYNFFPLIILFVVSYKLKFFQQKFPHLIKRIYWIRQITDRIVTLRNNFEILVLHYIWYLSKLQEWHKLLTTSEDLITSYCIRKHICNNKHLLLNSRKPTISLIFPMKQWTPIQPFIYIYFS